MPARRHLALIGFFTLVAFFLNLGGPRLWDRDEPRNAGCAREMLARHDWVVPVFNGELRTHKPVLLYWATMLAYGLFGINEFSARLPSALAATVTVLATYASARRLFGSRAAIWSALVLSSSLMFVVASRAATPDGLLICCSTLSLAAFVWLAFPPGQCGEVAGDAGDADRSDSPRGAEHRWPGFPKGWRGGLLIYAPMGMAVLAKGPVGLMLPTAVIGMYLLIARASGPPVTGQTETGGVSWAGRLWLLLRSAACWFEPAHFLRTCWNMRPLTALGMILIIAGPWYAWVAWRTDGQWLRGFLLEHNMGRALSPMEGHHGPIFYYPLALLIGFFPWSVFAAPIGLELTGCLRRGGRSRPALTFLVCWITVYVVLFSCARTKLPSYVTPAYPALAMLAGWFFDRLLAARQQVHANWVSAALAVLLVAGVAMCVGLTWAGLRYLPGEQQLGLVGLIPVVTALVGWRLWHRGRVPVALGTFGAGSLALMAAGFAWAADRVSDHQQCARLIGAPLQRQAAGAQLLAWGSLEPSWVFYSGRRIEEVPPAARGQLPERLSDPQRPAVLLTTRDQWQQLARELPWPAEVDVLAEAPYFLKRQQLVLVGRPPLVARHRTP